MLPVDKTQPITHMIVGTGEKGGYVNKKVEIKNTDLQKQR